MVGDRSYQRGADLSGNLLFGAAAQQAGADAHIKLPVVVADNFHPLIGERPTARMREKSAKYRVRLFTGCLRP